MELFIIFLHTLMESKSCEQMIESTSGPAVAMAANTFPPIVEIISLNFFTYIK